MIRETIKLLIIETLRELQLPEVSFVVERPQDMTHGDYATNIVLVLSKQVGTSPLELAERIVVCIEKKNRKEIESVSIAGPGFINFRITSAVFERELLEVINQKDSYGASTIYSGKTVLVEHSSPNLFKPFHIGHMMNNAIGESLVRLMQNSGATVRTMSFPSDISLGVAKAIFVLLEQHGADYKPSSISMLGDAYVEGTHRFETDESIHTRVKQIADNLYANVSSPELDIFNTCKKFNLEYFETVTARLGSHFDSYIFESEAGIVGKQLIEQYTPTIFTPSEGAIVYIPEETKKHIHTAVFINSQGNPTYEAKDLGLLSMKFEREHPDISIFVTDYQQVQHFDVVLDAAEKINSEWKTKSVHIPHGRMTFKGQKMSSRLGGVPLATEVLDLVIDEVNERAEDRVVEAATVDAIAIGAIKFAILKSKAGQNINFDPDTSLSFEGDSGPYIQYTHARITSLLFKGEQMGITPVIHIAHMSDTERILVHFKDVVEEAIQLYAPHVVLTFAIELAQSFNSFYARELFLDKDHQEASEHKLALAKAVQIVLARALYLVGIEAPTKM